MDIEGEIIREFSSAKEVKEELGIKQQVETIRNWAKNEKMAVGFRWKYKFEGYIPKDGEKYKVIEGTI